MKGQLFKLKGTLGTHLIHKGKMKSLKTPLEKITRSSSWHKVRLEVSYLLPEKYLED
jgi:hypothetical protein